MNKDVMFSSNTEEWATPQAFFDELNNEFDFTLDPCATPQNAKCARYYTKDVDGLAQSWRGEKVYCNPPYGREIGKWVKKAVEEANGGGDCGHALAGTNRHVVVSQVYIQKTRGPFYTRAVTFQRGKSGSAVPVNGGSD